MADTATNVLDKYQAAVEANPTSVDAQCNLGWGYYGERQYETAIEVFRQALKLDAGSVDANYGLAMSLKEAGQGEQAVPVFARVMKLAPQKETGARGRMLARLARGHINQIRKGDWDLDEDMKYEGSSEDNNAPPL
jgi:tetratricopeptide (TPR) repeat protein